MVGYIPYPNYESDIAELKELDRQRDALKHWQRVLMEKNPYTLTYTKRLYCIQQLDLRIKNLNYVIEVQVAHVVTTIRETMPTPKNPTI